MKGAPPLRFLGLVVGGWICARAVTLLAPEWMEAEAPVPPLVETRPAATTHLAATAKAAASLPCRSCRAAPREPVERRPHFAERWPGVERSPTSLGTDVVPLEVHDRIELPTVADLRPLFPPLLPLEADGTGRPPSRWSGSAWVFWRRGEGAQLATGGSLGGSQVGGRIAYRINHDVRRPVSISGRAYAPVNRPAASEVAVGMEWKPLAPLPIRLLAERRQAIGSEGRSAFALMAYGGVSEVRLTGDLTLEGYGQAGVVGIRSRDLFADGAVAVEFPIDTATRLRVGAAAWGAAQPGVSRLDVGPRLSLRIPLEDASLRLIADWRVRIAGSASPGSGPSLTLATDF